MAKPFLRAEWRKLVMANYEIDPDALKAFLPNRTELDTWNNKHYVSLVGFRFLETAVMGIKIPFHVNFPEINLRFYVRYREGNGWKRGVVFLKEIVPRPAISFVANTLYQENYISLPVKSEILDDGQQLSVSYKWKFRGRWNSISATGSNKAVALQENSEEEFITEHFWGYAKGRNNTTTQYQVEHPRWDIYQVNDYKVSCDFGALYGSSFAALETLTPLSVFVCRTLCAF